MSLTPRAKRNATRDKGGGYAGQPPPPPTGPHSIPRLDGGPSPGPFPRHPNAGRRATGGVPRGICVAWHLRLSGGGCRGVWAHGNGAPSAPRPHPHPHPNTFISHITRTSSQELPNIAASAYKDVHV